MLSFDRSPYFVCTAPYNFLELDFDTTVKALLIISDIFSFAYSSFSSYNCTYICVCINNGKLSGVILGKLIILMYYEA